MHAMRSARTAVSLPIRIVSAMVLLGGIAIAGDALATTYRIVLLQLPEAQGIYAYGLDINSAGEVVGRYSDSEGPGGTIREYAVKWSPPDYVMQILPSSEDGVVAREATRINDVGDIIGNAYLPFQPLYGSVMWKSGGPPIPLATIDQLSYEANDVNVSGVAVGRITGTEGLVAVWTDPLTVSELSTPSADATGYAVNDSGMIVGDARFSYRLHGFSRTPAGVVKDLGDLPGGKDYSTATDVNNSGQIVGYSESNVGIRAVLWDADGSMHDLGNFPSNPRQINAYHADRINNLGQVIGSAWHNNTYLAYWLWTPGAGMKPISRLIDPNDPLHDGTFPYVYGLNDAGVLVGRITRSGDPVSRPAIFVPQP